MKPELNFGQFVIGNIRELAINKTDQRQGYPAEQVDVSVGRKLGMVSRHAHDDSQTNPNDEIHNGDLQPYHARGIRHVASLVDETFCSAKARPTAHLFLSSIEDVTPSPRNGPQSRWSHQNRSWGYSGTPCSEARLACRGRLRVVSPLRHPRQKSSRPSAQRR